MPPLPGDEPEGTRRFSGQERAGGTHFRERGDGGPSRRSDPFRDAINTGKRSLGNDYHGRERAGYRYHGAGDPARSLVYLRGKKQLPRGRDRVGNNHLPENIEGGVAGRDGKQQAAVDEFFDDECRLDAFPHEQVADDFAEKLTKETGNLLS